MCTVTWLQEPGSCLLFFNRDEKKTRQPGLPPQLESRNGVSYICPYDSDCGGTWLFVNTCGLIAGLLNYYPQPLPAAPAAGISRGLLLLSCVSDPDIATLDDRIENTALGAYRPFTLIALQPDHPARQWQWDGRHLSCNRQTPIQQPVTSSSYHSAEVEAVRRETYQKQLDTRNNRPPDEAFLADYHYQHRPERGAHSVCMLREDAETESISRIQVDRTHIRFSYRAKIPESLAFREPLDQVTQRKGVPACS